MGCFKTNTTVNVLRQTRTITAGAVSSAESTIHTGIDAYTEPIATDYRETPLGRKGARRAIFVVDDLDIVPEDSLLDVGDSSRPYAITDYLRFKGSHIELRCEEEHYGD